MYDLTALRERLRTQRPVPWDQLPDFSLYGPGAQLYGPAGDPVRRG